MNSSPSAASKTGVLKLNLSFSRFIKSSAFSAARSPPLFSRALSLLGTSLTSSMYSLSFSQSLSALSKSFLPPTHLTAPVSDLSAIRFCMPPLFNGAPSTKSISPSFCKVIVLSSHTSTLSSKGMRLIASASAAATASISEKTVLLPKPLGPVRMVIPSSFISIS